MAQSNSQSAGSASNSNAEGSSGSISHSSWSSESSSSISASFASGSQVSGSPSQPSNGSASETSASQPSDSVSQSSVSASDASASASEPASSNGNGGSNGGNGSNGNGGPSASDSSSPPGGGPCSVVAVHPGTADFSQGNAGKILISALHGGGYFTSFQTEDRKVVIRAEVEPVLEGQTVYLEVIDPDDPVDNANALYKERKNKTADVMEPDDLMDDIDSEPNDNRDSARTMAGETLAQYNSFQNTCLLSRSALTEKRMIGGEEKAVAEVVLTITNRYAGDNYPVRAMCIDPDDKPFNANSHVTEDPEEHAGISCDRCCRIQSRRLSAKGMPDAAVTWHGREVPVKALLLLLLPLAICRADVQGWEDTGVNRSREKARFQMTYMDTRGGSDIDLIFDTRRVIVPELESTVQAEDLILRVEFQERPYLLGEPVFVRCMIINETADSITIPYSYVAGRKDASVSFVIETHDGRRIPPLQHAEHCISLGEPLTIPSGHKFIHTIDLAHDYALVSSGEFQITAEYNSGGQHYDFDREKGMEVAKPAWGGHLSAEVGRIVLRQPTEEEDQDALERLVQGLGPHGQGRWQDRRYAILFWGMNQNRDLLADEHPGRYYAGYARFYSADDRLTSGRWRVPALAARALPLLEGIELRRYPELFQEMVLHRLILVNIGVGSPPERLAPLVEEFRSRFPDSPYPLPEQVREAAQ